LALGYGFYVGFSGNIKPENPVPTRGRVNPPLYNVKRVVKMA